jgi:hypothetical protein
MALASCSSFCASFDRDHSLYLLLLLVSLCTTVSFNFSFFKTMLKISSRCLYFPCKRRQKRSSLDKFSEKNGFIPPSIHSDIIYNMFENSQYLDDDIFLTTRASSAASSRNADDIEFTHLTSARKKKTIPHYATPLRRSAKVAPTSTSLDTYVFGSRQASKISQ